MTNFDSGTAVVDLLQSSNSSDGTKHLYLASVNGNQIESPEVSVPVPGIGSVVLLNPDPAAGQVQASSPDGLPAQSQSANSILLSTSAQGSSSGTTAGSSPTGPGSGTSGNTNPQGGVLGITSGALGVAVPFTGIGLNPLDDLILLTGLVLVICGAVVTSMSRSRRVRIL